MSKLIAHNVALELIRVAAPAIRRIERADRDLARQLRRATASTVLNLAEGDHSDGGNQRARFFTAAGSAKEVKSALQVAEAFGYFADPATLELADRVVALTWQLARSTAPR